MPNLLNRAEIADLFGVSPRCVNNWVDEGLPRVRGFGQRRYGPAATATWLLKRELVRLDLRDVELRQRALEILEETPNDGLLARRIERLKNLVR
jgi:phage terminase Nu1 subunit (DNA packaging protein)